MKGDQIARACEQFYPELKLEGRGTDLLWTMADGDEPHVIGVRLDCGDSGAVYVTKEQALMLSVQLRDIVTQLG